jgi:hypothetical protein
MLHFLHSINVNHHTCLTGSLGNPNMAAGVIKQSRSKEEKQVCVQCSCIISAQKEWDNKQLQDPEKITKELQDLQLDRTELNSLLKAFSRRSVREVICLETDINLA